MSDIEHICGECGTHFTYPKDITGKIRVYLLGNEYKQINHGEDVKRYIKGLDNEILLYNRPTFKDSYFATITINKIAAHERRSFGSVLRDILSDNEDKVKFLEGQLAMFGKWLADTTEDEWVNRAQITSKIAQLKEQIAECEVAHETI